MKYAFTGLATLLGGFLVSYSAQAQGNYVDDALLYSRLGPGGPARTLGVAGANVALGGDFGNLSSNPAGLGFFTKSEANFTPGLGFGNSTSTPITSLSAAPSLQQEANSFHVASAGVVFANRRADTDNSSDWRGGAFSLGFTRQADYNQAFRYQNTTDDQHSFFQFLREPGGYSDYTSTNYQNAVQRILAQDNSQQYVNLDGLAYGGYLTGVNQVKVNGVTYNQIVREARSGSVLQNEVVTSKGSLSQFDLGYGGNYRDRLYLGAAIGLVSTNRTRTSTFGEIWQGEEDFHYDDYLKTTGFGINARLGAIYRAADVVRFGASIQTPTYIQLTDEYNTTLSVNQGYLPTGAATTYSTVPGTYEYSITTPFRANGGVAVLLGKYGFLTGDIEYVGYSKSRYHTTDGAVDDEIDGANQLIARGYRNTINLRFGAEGRFDIFRVRAGYARYNSPYAGQSPFDRNQNYYTGGLGIRTKAFFVDVAGMYSAYKDRYSPYSLATTVAPTIDTTYKRFTTSITGGIIF